jgi:transcriptional regulator of met regulon
MPMNRRELDELLKEGSERSLRVNLYTLCQTYVSDEDKKHCYNILIDRKFFYVANCFDKRNSDLHTAIVDGSDKIGSLMEQRRPNAQDIAAALFTKQADLALRLLEKVKTTMSLDTTVLNFTTNEDCYRSPYNIPQDTRVEFYAVNLADAFIIYPLKHLKDSAKQRYIDYIIQKVIPELLGGLQCDALKKTNIKTILISLLESNNFGAFAKKSAFNIFLQPTNIDLIKELISEELISEEQTLRSKFLASILCLNNDSIWNALPFEKMSADELYQIICHITSVNKTTAFDGVVKKILTENITKITSITQNGESILKHILDKKRYSNIVIGLFDKIKDVNAEITRTGDRLIHSLARANDREKLFRAFLRSRRDIEINAKNNQGETALDVVKNISYAFRIQDNAEKLVMNAGGTINKYSEPKGNKPRGKLIFFRDRYVIVDPPGVEDTPGREGRRHTSVAPPTRQEAFISQPKRADLSQPTGAHLSQPTRAPLSQPTRARLQAPPPTHPTHSNNTRCFSTPRRNFITWKNHAAQYLSDCWSSINTFIEPLGWGMLTAGVGITAYTSLSTSNATLLEFLISGSAIAVTAELAMVVGMVCIYLAHKDSVANSRIYS